MKYLIFLVTIAVASIPALAQNVKPTPPPTDDNDVVKISTNLIQLDVSVTDKKGRPIRDLRPDEIEIYENGKKQEISNFSYFAPGSDATGEKNETGIRSEDKNTLISPVVAPAPLAKTSVHRTIAIVVDDLTLSVTSIKWVKEALRKYVDEQIQDGDLVAIIRTAGGSGALQQFTTDKRRLSAAVDNIQYYTLSSSGVGTFEPITRDNKDLAYDKDPRARDLTDDIKNDLDRLAQADKRRAGVSSTGTLGVLNFTIHSIEDLPGRKSIVLMSNGIRLYGRDINDRPTSSIVAEPLRRMIDQANRANVVIYTVDARGNETFGMTAVDDPPPALAERLSVKRALTISDTQAGLRYLADETGGFMSVSNDINEALGRVIDDQSYYLVGYVPDSDTFDVKANKFNKIEVKVLRPGAKVRHRSGFFAVTDADRSKAKQSGAQAAVDAILSPFRVNDLAVRLHTLFSTDQKRSLWVKSYLHIDINNLKFTEQANGDKTVDINITAVSFGDNGTVADQMARKFTLTLNPQAYKASLESGFVYQFAFQAKKPGPYQYRVAVRDSSTDKIGSASEFIEVPDIANGRLPLSGIVLKGSPKKGQNAVEAAAAETNDSVADTVLRQFKQGDVLEYGLQIYNARTNGSAIASGLTAKMRVLNGSAVVLTGKVTPVAGKLTGEGIEYLGGFNIGRDMSVGNYILEISILDAGSSGKQRSATQYVEFEVVP